MINCQSVQVFEWLVVGENHHDWWTFTVLGWLLAWKTPYQDSNQERTNRAIVPPRNFCKHDGIHALHMKSHFSRLRYLYVNFFSRQLFRIRAASYWIKQLNNQCTMLPKTSSTESQTSFEAQVLKWNQSRRNGGFGGLIPPKQSSKLPQIKIWNIINQSNFCQVWMSSPFCTNVKPSIDDFLATVLSETIRFMKLILWL